jgi:hypothetical protein
VERGEVKVVIAAVSFEVWCRHECVEKKVDVRGGTIF